MMNRFNVRPLAVVALLASSLLPTVTVAAPPGDFKVESPADGKTFKLSDAKGKYVALHFLLKTECPFCLKHTRDYAKKSAATPDVVHVFLKPDSAEDIKAWSTKANRGDDFADVAIYRDAEAKLAELKEKPAALPHYNLGADKVAISGYDPVGYFTQSKALKGRKEINAQHRGVTYQFATEDNKKLFVASPEKFLPTYGGWCATAMAKGEKVEIDPTNFKVTNGRLFLFFKAFYANAIKDWNKDEPGQTAKADASWKKLAGE